MISGIDAESNVLIIIRGAYLCSRAKREFSIRTRVVILRVVILRVRKLKGIE